MQASVAGINTFKDPIVRKEKFKGSGGDKLTLRRRKECSSKTVGEWQKINVEKEDRVQGKKQREID